MSNRSKRRPPLRRPVPQAPTVSETPAPTLTTGPGPLEARTNAVDALMQLRTARTRQLRAERDIRAALRNCHAAGVTDVMAGSILGISRQAVRARRVALETP